MIGTNDSTVQTTYTVGIILVVLAAGLTGLVAMKHYRR